MKTLSIAEVAQNFTSVVAALESGREEVLVMRNRKAVARLVPEPNHDGDTLSGREAELWATINLALPLESRAAYRALRRKAGKGNLTAAEHKRLLLLTDELEMLQAQRVKALVSLASLHGTTVAELANSTGIKVSLDA